MSVPETHHAAAIGAAGRWELLTWHGGGLIATGFLFGHDAGNHRFHGGFYRLIGSWTLGPWMWAAVPLTAGALIVTGVVKGRTRVADVGLTFAAGWYFTASMLALVSAARGAGMVGPIGVYLAVLFPKAMRHLRINAELRAAAGDVR